MKPGVHQSFKKEETIEAFITTASVPLDFIFFLAYRSDPLEDIVVVGELLDRKLTHRA
jgi:hypothetical protein